MRAQVGKFTLSGDGLCVGRDSGDAVSSLYTSSGTFTGGTIIGVGVSVEKAQYPDLEKMAAAAFAGWTVVSMQKDWGTVFPPVKNQ